MKNYHIPEEKISEIRSAADIVDIVSEVVLLKKAGQNLVGLCPFHTEKTPSFNVSPERQIFHCFGCGVGGDVFEFLMRYEGSTFPDTARMLAIRYGVVLPDQSMSPEERHHNYEREQLFEIHREAARFFRAALLRSHPGKSALSYLAGRDIPPDMPDEFQLGYALPEWDGLLDFFQRKRTPVELLLKSGLIIPRKTGNGFYDRFRNRIIFPIRNMRGQVIAFGGRVMDDSLPKYLNSPETPLFSKRRSLYGLHTARRSCRETGVVYMTEGYFDVISLFRHGIPNTVATLGTALTADHVRILRAFARQVVLVYDSDQAGIQAALKGVDIFQEQEMEARILILPQGYDPDSFVREFGADAFREKAQGALSMIEFLMEEAVKKYGRSLEGKVRIISAMEKPLMAVRDSMTRSLYIRKMAECVGVDEAVILEKLRRTRVPPKNMRGAEAGLHRNAGPPVRGVAWTEKTERQIIAMMLQFPDIIPEFERRNLVRAFEIPVFRSLGQTILACKQFLSQGIPELINRIDDEEKRQIAASLAFGHDEWNYERCLCLIGRFESGWKGRRKDLLQRIEAARQENNQTLLLELLKEKQIQARERRTTT